jgi:cytochrome oxidase assembly protein ShyY1
MNENVECSETKMNLRVTLDWRTTLATAVLLPTLLFLGFWQLDRADEKVEPHRADGGASSTAPDYTVASAAASR